MTFDPNAFGNLKPWITEIEIIADGETVFKGPLLEISFSWDRVGMKFPTPEYLERMKKWAT